MRAVTWYFDFISPYSYFGLNALKRLPTDVALDYQPVLFAGLLNHWGQKGPAEVPPKRIWTLRSCIWWAKQNNVPFRFPAAHPFNSLPYLRLSIAAGNSPDAIQKIFAALWTTGCNPADPKVISGLAASLRVPLDRIAEADVKDALRDATSKAVQRDVFGVPSLRIDEYVFWGNDAVDFAVAYLADPGILATDEVKHADTLPIGVSRPGVSGSL